MVVRAVSFHLSLPAAASLKDKRMVLRSVRDRLRRLNVSVAETAHQDAWTRAEITVAYVSANAAQADAMEEKVDALLDRVHDLMILDTQRRHC